jgi:uncharacterized cupredoxin-like copper-binding protein
MKKLLIVLTLIGSTLFLAACGNKQAPMTEAEQAASYGLSMSEYQEQKEAAARMGMTVEEHLKMEEDGEMDMDMDENNMDM